MAKEIVKRQMIEPAKKSTFRWIFASIVAAGGYVVSFVILNAALFFLTGVQLVSTALGHYADVHSGFALLLSLAWTILTAGIFLGIHDIAQKIMGDIGQPVSKRQNTGRILAWSLGSLVCLLYWYSTIPGNLKVMDSIRRSAAAARYSNGR